MNIEMLTEIELQHLIDVIRTNSNITTPSKLRDYVQYSVVNGKVYHESLLDKLNKVVGVTLEIDTLYAIRDEEDNWMQDLKYIGRYRLPDDPSGIAYHIFIGTDGPHDNFMTYLNDDELTEDTITKMKTQ